MTEYSPEWGLFYPHDTYPRTYICTWKEAMRELEKFGSEVKLMVMHNGDWTEVLHD